MTDIRSTSAAATGTGEQVEAVATQNDPLVVVWGQCLAIIGITLGIAAGWFLLVVWFATTVLGGHLR